MVTQIVEPEDYTPLVCDFCSHECDGATRYCFNDKTNTVHICNFCIMRMHASMMQIDTLRFMPKPEYTN